MKKEIEKGQESLIQHIELKLAQLRSQRDKLQQRKYPVSVINRTIQPTMIPKFTQKQQLQKNLAQLQQLYEVKKQLRSAGILTNDVSEINRYKNDPKLKQEVQKRKKKVAENQQKMKIINEQMQKAQKFLKSKKVQQKVIANMQEMNYRIILKDKKQQLNKFWELVNHTTLNRVQKQQLINMTFQMLRQWNQLVKKQNLKKFLLANPQFCQHFYITHAQITRDLQVLQTKQQNSLSLLQLTQFIKSIQLTNVHLLPASQKNRKQQKQLANKLINNLVTQQIINTKQNQSKQKEYSERQVHRALVQFLRKVFRDLDRSSEGIVERAKFINVVMKANNNSKKDKCIDVQLLRKFGNFVMERTKQKCTKSYYKELDAKFINFSEIQSLCRQFKVIISKKSQEKQNIESQEKLQIQAKENQDKVQILQQEEQSEQPSMSTEINLSKQQGKQLTQKDYKRYGWSHTKQQLELKDFYQINQNQDENNQKIQIQNLRNVFRHKQSNLNAEQKMKKMDEYYRQVSKKYGNQIAWGGFEEYKPDFKQLEQFIKLQQKKMQNEIQTHQESHKRAEQVLNERKQSKIRAQTKKQLSKTKQSRIKQNSIQ